MRTKSKQQILTQFINHVFDDLEMICTYYSLGKNMRSKLRSRLIGVIIDTLDETGEFDKAKFLAELNYD